MVSNGTWFKKVLAEDELICCVLEESSGLWEKKDTGFADDSHLGKMVRHSEEFKCSWRVRSETMTKA